MIRLIVTTSWDDGSISDLKLAELLDKYRVKGTFYVPKTYLDTPLGKNDLKTLDKVHEIGAHTLNHTVLTKIPLAEADKEIRGSKTYLEDLLGHRLTMFAYPKGCYNQYLKKLVADCGFIAARAVIYQGFALPRDLFAWGVTALTSNMSPLFNLRTCLNSRISVKSLLDWELRARLLFDLALNKGGIFHLFGHSHEIEEELAWGKLERLLKHISGRNGVSYLTNGEALSR